MPRMPLNLVQNIRFRISHLVVFCKRAALKTFTELSGKTGAIKVFSSEVTSYSPLVNSNSINGELPVSFAELIRTF